jgi:hypothetical protein
LEDFAAIRMHDVPVDSDVAAGVPVPTATQSTSVGIDNYLETVVLHSGHRYDVDYGEECGRSDKGRTGRSGGEAEDMVCCL